MQNLPKVNKVQEEVAKYRASLSKVVQQSKEAIQRIEENRKKVEEKIYQYCKALAEKQNSTVKSMESLFNTVAAEECMCKMLSEASIKKLECDMDGLAKSSNAVRIELEGLSKNVVSNIEAINASLQKVKQEFLGTKSMEILNNKTEWHYKLWFVINATIITFEISLNYKFILNNLHTFWEDILYFKIIFPIIAIHVFW